MKIQIKKLREDAIIPKKGSAGAAAYDLYACIDKPVTIWPGSTEMIGTGIAVALPEGYFAGIYARSGLASKNGIRPANCVGICDSDYRGEYIVALHNDSSQRFKIKPGDRIAQLIIQKHSDIEFEEVPELDDTARGAGGFGSTGVQ